MASLARFNPLNWAITERTLEWWDGRAVRERLMMAFLAVVVLLFFGYLAAQTMNTSLKEAQSRRDRAMASKGTVEAMHAEYLARAAESKEIEQYIDRFKDFSPAGFLERTAKEMELTEQLGNLNDRGVQAGEPFPEHLVDVRLGNVTLAQLVDLLYRIEAEEAPLRVTSLRAKANTRERAEITVTMTVSMLRPPASAGATP